MNGYFKFPVKAWGLVVMLMSIFFVSGCRPEPTVRHSSCQLHMISLDSEHGVVFYANDKVGEKILETTPDGLLKYNGEGVYSVKGQWRTLRVVFEDDRYPQSLDNLFVIENITDKKQRCFAYMTGNSGSYRDSIFNLMSDIKGIDTYKENFEQGILNLIHMTKDGRAGIDVYWDEVHAVNPSVAIELQPKEKVYMKWE